MPPTLEQRLMERSSLTRAQVESMGLHVLVRRRELTDAEAARRRGKEGVTLGSYYRVLGQGRTNTERALFTLLLTIRMGVVRMENLRRLLELMAKTPSGIEEGSSVEVMSLIDALVKHVVTV